MQTIEKWSLNKHKLTTTKANLSTFDDTDLFKKGGDRIDFYHTKEVVTLPTYFYIVDGVLGEEDAFYDRIYDLNIKLSRHSKLYLKFDKGLDKNIKRETIDAIRTEWDSLERRDRVNTPNIIRFLEMHRSILNIKNNSTRACVLEGLRNYFDDYFTTHGSNAKSYEAKNILIHLVYWSNLYINQLFEEFDYSGKVPKILYYGTISKREAYFLDFANRIGIDVIYINTQADTPLSTMDVKKEKYAWSNAPRTTDLKPFPTERINTTVSTEAYDASEELRETLHSDDSMFYRPWQFVNYNVDSVNLITTYEEIAILADEKAMMRSGWQVGQGHVTLPSFFTKIAGVHHDVDQYYNEVNYLRKLHKTKFIDQLPLCPPTRHLLKDEYYKSCGKGYKIDEDKLLQADFWPYKHIQDHLQKLLVRSIIEFCNFKGIKRQKKYGVEEQKLVIFTTLMTINMDYLQLLQQFDYPKEVPKCIIYNTEVNGEMSFEDAILIYFLNSVGVDIFVFNPSGQNDIEIYIEDALYNKHHLEEVAFNLPFKTFSLFGKYIR